MKYSIITVNLNNKDGLRKTIESVVSQSYGDFEYIIIDGGSTDGSVEVIKEYEEHIAYWVSEPDTGIYNAMNKGIRQAHGDYLNFMNSGDCFHKDEILRRMLPYLDSDIVVGRAQCGSITLAHYKDSITMLDFVKSTLPHQASFFRKSLFDSGKYDEKYKIISDWKFYIEKLIFGNATFHNTDLMVCHFEGGGISATARDEVDKETYEVYREFLPERALQDYFHWKKVDSPIFELTPRFNKTYGFQKLILIVVKCMIEVREFLLSIKAFFHPKR